ncbi:RNA polymerase sigma factor [Pseudomonas aeruginosa]|nr:RNA polymerase sigma factor [Pseudomonas aeruginosa]
MDERFRGSVSHAYQAFHGELLRFLRKHLGSSADAADLAQDTFAQWLKWPGRQSVEQPRAFLFQIARNLLRDHWAPAAEPRPGSRPAGGERRTRRAGRRGGRAGGAFRTAAAPQPPGGRAGRAAAAAARSVRPAQVRRPVPGRSGRAHGNLPEHGGKAHRQRLAALQAAAWPGRRRMKPLERLEPLFADENRRGHRSPRRLLVQPASFRAFQRCLPGRAGGLATRRSAPSRSARGHGAALARVRRPAAPRR